MCTPLRGPFPLAALLALGILPPFDLQADELRWNWPPDQSYQFEQTVKMAILFVDDVRSRRDEINFSQTVTAETSEITDGIRVAMKFAEPRFRATTRVNGRNRRFDSGDRTNLSHPAWKPVQVDVAALKKSARVATFDRKGRMAVVSGLGRYPKLPALSGRTLLGQHSESLLAFSTTFLPPKSVQPGDTWTVKLPNRFEEMLELVGPIQKTTWSAEATFDKIVKRWKRDHASITYRGGADLASKEDPETPFARYSLSGRLLLDLEKGLEIEADMTIRFAIHPSLAAQAKKERFWFSITSTAQQRLTKVKPL